MGKGFFGDCDQYETVIFGFKIFIFKYLLIFKFTYLFLNIFFHIFIP